MNYKLLPVQQWTNQSIWDMEKQKIGYSFSLILFPLLYVPSFYD